MKNVAILSGAENLIGVCGGNFGGDGGAFGIFYRAEFVVVCLDNVGLIFFCGGVKFFESVRLDPVVWLENTNVCAVSAFEAEIHTVAVARIGFVDDLDAGVLGGEFLDDFEGLVGGAIVDTDDLEILEGLTSNTSERLAQICFDVINGDQNREGGSGCCSRHVLIIQ